MIALRSSQGAAIAAARAQIAEGKTAGVIVAPCGFGKSVVAAAFIHAAMQKGTKVWFAVDRQILVNDMSNRLQSYGIDHGVMMAGHWRWKPQHNVQVVSLQTIERRGWDAGIGLLIIDECFPAGTLISTTMGEKPIEFVRSGDMVYTQHGIGKVQTTMCRPATETYLLELSNGKHIECTGNHRIFTEAGWVEARNVEVGSCFFTIQGMRSLWETVLTLGKEGRNGESNFDVARETLDHASMLLSVVCKEIEESDEQSSISIEDESEIERDKTQTYSSWRQRAIAAFASVGTSSRAWRGVGGGVSCGDENAPSGDRDADLLQDRHSESEDENRDRDRRLVAHIESKKRAGLEESEFPSVVRVVNISRVKRPSAIPVFNLHINGHPSYFANGISVHNCHANLRKSVLEFAKRSPRTKILGLTATPFTRGMGKIYEYVVNPTTTYRQIEEGHLVPLTIYSCTEADMRGAKTVAGEYADEEVRARGAKIYGNIVQTWMKKSTEYFGGPAKTIVFSANVAHGQDICKSFAEAGFNFVQISYQDADQERRDAIIREFRKPDSTIHGLVSCGVLTRGFDVTDVRIGIMARPLRKSFSEFIQQIGRIQRAHPGKEFGLLLDHAGNVGRFLQEMERLFYEGVKELDEADAKPPRKELTEGEKKEIFCPKCGALRARNSFLCACGYEWPRRKTVQNVEGHLRLVKGLAIGLSARDLWQQVATHANANSAPEKRLYRARHLFRDIAGHNPPDDWTVSVPPVPISLEVRKKIKSINLRWVFSKRRAA